MLNRILFVLRWAFQRKEIVAKAEARLALNREMARAARAKAQDIATQGSVVALTLGEILEEGFCHLQEAEHGQWPMAICPIAIVPVYTGENDSNGNPRTRNVGMPIEQAEEWLRQLREDYAEGMALADEAERRAKRLEKALAYGDPHMLLDAIA